MKEVSGVSFPGAIHYLKPMNRISNLMKLRGSPSPFSLGLSSLLGPSNPTGHDFHVITSSDLIIHTKYSTPHTSNFFVLKSLTRDGTLGFGPTCTEDPRDFVQVNWVVMMPQRKWGKGSCSLPVFVYEDRMGQ